MFLDEFERQAIEDRLEGFELVEYLQIPIEWVLRAAEDLDWINGENVEDLLEFVGVRR